MVASADPRSKRKTKQPSTQSRKRSAKKRAPTYRERRAAAQVERAEWTDRLWNYLAAAPKDVLCRITGRRHQQLQRWAQDGMPYGGAKVDVTLAVTWLVDRFVELKGREAKSNIDPLEEAIRKEKFLQLRLDNLERQGKLVSRERNREGLLRLGALLKEFGEWLRKRHPEGDTVEKLNEFLDRWDRELEDRFPPGEFADH